MDARYLQLPLPNGFDSGTFGQASCLAFTEGPAVDADGNVYFSDIENSRIYRLAPDGTRTVFREPSHRTNGQTFDQAGRPLPLRRWRIELGSRSPNGPI